MAGGALLFDLGGRGIVGDFECLVVVHGGGVISQAARRREGAGGARSEVWLCSVLVFRCDRAGGAEGTGRCGIEPAEEHVLMLFFGLRPCWFT